MFLWSEDAVFTTVHMLHIFSALLNYSCLSILFWTSLNGDQLPRNLRSENPYFFFSINTKAQHLGKSAVTQCFPLF